MRTNREGEEGEKEKGGSESLVAAWRGVCEKWKRLKVGQQQPASSKSGEGVRRHGAWAHARKLKYPRGRLLHEARRLWQIEAALCLFAATLELLRVIEEAPTCLPSLRVDADDRRVSNRRLFGAPLGKLRITRRTRTPQCRLLSDLSNTFTQRTSSLSSTPPWPATGRTEGIGLDYMHVSSSVLAKHHL